jgi:hypothetical protein
MACDPRVLRSASSHSTSRPEGDVGVGHFVLFFLAYFFRVGLAVSGLRPSLFAALHDVL